MIAGLAIHEASREFVYPLSRCQLVIRMRVTRQYARECCLMYWNRNLEKFSQPAQIRMSCYARDAVFDYYEALITTEKATRYIQYYFRIATEAGLRYVNFYSMAGTYPPEEGFFEYCYTSEQDIFSVPEWAKEAVVYQIFPDRFYNGNLLNDPEDTAVWGSKPTREISMGGDLQGIIQKLDYLQELGINTLYLNPIFYAPSNHKYDTIDYFRVDPQFGTLHDLRDLVLRCHARSIHVLLDGVFNHCGYYFGPFLDVLENGANSAFVDWFYLDGFPVDGDQLNYETIGYYKMMPKLRLSHPDVRQFFFEVALYWMDEAGIDGWRLDVAEEVDFTFWQKFRFTLKAAYPNCFLLAETWKENRDLLRGDQMDSLINYVFREAVVDFFAKGRIGSLDFDARINQFRGVYSGIAHPVLFNPLGSHDTPRILTLCEADLGRMKAAIAFQFCFPGIPTIYYGDEIGLKGGADPGCRKAMEWSEDRQIQTLLDWYKQMIRLRADLPALRFGGFISSFCQPSSKVYGFIRRLDGALNKVSAVYVIINSGDVEEQISLPVLEALGSGELTDLLTGGLYPIQSTGSEVYYNSDINPYEGMVRLALIPYQVCVLTLAEGGIAYVNTP